ncbi:MAG: leucyl aminopeptidase [Flavobacteriaceae bacterium]
MASEPKITFVDADAPSGGAVVLAVSADLKFGPLGRAVDKASGGAVSRAAKAAEFTGKAEKTCLIPSPGKGEFDKVMLVGVGDAVSMSRLEAARLGGRIAALAGHGSVSVVVELGKEIADAETLAAVASGIALRSYSFDRYKTRKDDNGDEGKAASFAILAGKPAAARKAWGALSPVVEGTLIARDLVNEPANVLGPVEFAARCKALEKVGVEVEILTEKEMGKLGMRALLGVNQGSVRPPRLAIMRWNGGKSKEAPVAFIGKGVVFDTGGISIKPAAGMEDMKGDMAGAACVTGLMHALAARKAKVNAIGAVGLVENMPDGNAQRPGDIVTSMSGQTIEIINTDAEGRLVLADVLWHIKEKYKPKFMVDLATLTGAVIIALGHHNAGLYSNDDELAARMIEAGLETGENVWRLPLGPAYDKLINSKFADMKNTGGRAAGSVTAAQFLKRFVGDVPWAHLDIAGTGMDSPNDELSKGWASGYGVRLLNRLVANHYE